MNKKLASFIIGTVFAVAASLSMGAVGASAAVTNVITNGSPTTTGTTATISGTYSTTGSGGADTYFSWGPTPSLGTHTALFHDSVSSDTFTATLTGLTPGVQYFYQAFASNSTTGPGYGTTLSFTTTANAIPSVLTMSASHTANAATLNGFFNGHGASTQTEFIWGLSASNLTEATGFVTQSGASGNFTANLGSLAANTTYYFQAVAKTAGGTKYGTTLSFTTSPGSTGGSCTIDAFNSSSYSITSGAPVTLSWTTVGCTSGSINNGVGTASPIASGSTYISGLFSTETFTLTATDGTQTDTKNVTVTVNGGGTGSCTITSFYPTTSSISSGASDTLNYTTSTGCTSWSMSPSLGTISSDSGNLYVPSLYATTTYTLHAYDGSGNQITQQTTIYVNGGGSGTTGGGSGSCQITSFYASPSGVTYGGSTTLYWNTTGCANAYLSGGVGGSGTSSSVNTGALYYSTTYTLTATDSYGASVNSQIYVTVNNGGTTSGTTTGYYGSTTTGYSGYCVINSLTASPTTVTNGQSATLSWNTSGCTSTSLTGGSIYTRFEPANGSDSTGTLYGTTTYTLYGNGGTSASQSVTVYVTNSPYPYQYTCQSGSYDPSCSGQYANSIITIPATNVGSTTARLNGIANGITSSFAGYFEYGTTASLGQATGFQNTFPVTSYNYYDTIATTPSTLYYYRAAAQINGTIVRGNILSFTTPASSSTNIVYVQGNSSSSSSSNSSSTTGSSTTPSGVLVTVSDQSESYNVGDTVNYTVTYTNGTNKTLTDAVLTVVMPQGFSVKQTTQGMMQPPTMVTANIGTLAPNQTGSIFIVATVEANVATDQTLVTNATLAYTLPNNMHDSAVGYVLNHASVQNVFAGFALGSGFFPTTIWGWFFAAIIILIIILISRRIARAKHGAADHGHADPHAHAVPPKH